MKKEKYIFLFPLATNGGVETHFRYLLDELNNNSNIIVLTRFWNPNTNISKFCQFNGIRIIFLNSSIILNFLLVFCIRFQFLKYSIIFYTTELSISAAFYSNLFFVKKTILNPVGNPNSIVLQLQYLKNYFRKPTIVVESKLHISFFNVDTYVLPHISNLKSYLPLEKSFLKSFVFAFLHRLDENKNPIDVVKSFAVLKSKFPFVKLYLTKEGPLFSAVLDLVNLLNCYESVEFLDNWNTIDDLKYIYKNVHVSILWSKSEGLPLTLIESIAFNRPFISSNVGAVHSLLNFTNNSVIIQNYSIQSLTNVMSYYVENWICSVDIVNEKVSLFNDYFGSSNLCKKYFKILQS